MGEFKEEEEGNGIGEIQGLMWEGRSEFEIDLGEGGRTGKRKEEREGEEKVEEEGK